MSLSFLFDEGMPRRLVRALGALGKDVEHVLDNHDPGTSDVDLLEYAGSEGKVFVSREKKMPKVPAERDAITQHGVGVFLLACRKLKFWEIVELVFRQWRTIEECARAHRPPYVFCVRKRGRKFPRVGP